MKQALIIGSTVVDIVINLPHIPHTGEDVHVTSQTMSLGGCAYNASHILRHFKVPYTLFSPVGKGTYGDFVRSRLAQQGITSPIPTPDAENGCCYCFVEDTGERTFASYHGAEYLFSREWFDLLDASTIDKVYLCGLEIEETTGGQILDYLEMHPEYTVYFAPGPRITVITSEKMKRVLSLSPVLHLNETEALEFTGLAGKVGSGGQTLGSPVAEAARRLYDMTRNAVIITLGACGAYVLDESGASFRVPGEQAEQVDTIGAGDAHIGAIIACLMRGCLLPEAVSTANKVSAAVVGIKGAVLSAEDFNKLGLI